MEGLAEAQNELMLVDDEDAARYRFGECFLHIGNDDADQRIGKGVQRCICKEGSTLLARSELYPKAP